MTVDDGRLAAETTVLTFLQALHGTEEPDFGDWLTDIRAIGPENYYRPL